MNGHDGRMEGQRRAVEKGERDAQRRTTRIEMACSERTPFTKFPDGF